MDKHDDAVTVEKVNELAIEFLGRTTTAWLHQKLPLITIAHGMISAGAAALELHSGRQAAIGALDEIRTALAEKDEDDQARH